MTEIEKVERATGNALIGAQVAYGYFAQAWLWRLRLHVFLGAQPGEAMHDHPWSFVSLPFMAYVEDVLDRDTGKIERRVIPAWRLNRKPATHTHAYVGKWSGQYVNGVPTVSPGAVVTICVRGPIAGDWKYWRVSRGRVRAYDWRTYLKHVERKPRRVLT